MSVPAVLLTDRMGYLRAGTVANIVVPHPEYVHFCGATCLYRPRLAVFSCPATNHRQNRSIERPLWPAMRLWSGNGR